eukprot:1033011-Alexandrium_andersonii.AAC.1
MLEDAVRGTAPVPVLAIHVVEAVQEHALFRRHEVVLHAELRPALATKVTEARFLELRGSSVQLVIGGNVVPLT